MLVVRVLGSLRPRWATTEHELGRLIRWDSEVPSLSPSSAGLSGFAVSESGLQDLLVETGSAATKLSQSDNLKGLRRRPIMAPGRAAGGRVSDSLGIDPP